MEVFVEWARESAMHGLGAAFLVTPTRNNNQRNIWKLLFCSFVLFCLYFQSRLLYEIMFVKPVIVEFSYDRKSEIEFPNVVACNLNNNFYKFVEYFEALGNTGLLNVQFTQFTLNELFEQVRQVARVNTTLMQMKYPLLEKQYSEFLAITDPAWAAAIRYRETLAATVEQHYDPKYVEDDIMGLFDLELMYLLVTAPLQQQWKGRDCVNEKEWSLRRTKNVYCHEFAPSDRTISHPQQKLTLLLDFMMDEGIGYYDVGGGASIQVFLYEPEKTVFNTWDKSYSFDIAPGKSFDVQVSTRTFSDETNFNGCIQEGKRGNSYRSRQLRYYDAGYSHALCVSECLIDFNYELCGCVPDNGHNYNFTPIVFCSTINIIMCPLDMPQIYKSCNQKCKPQCSWTKYNFEKTWTKFPSYDSYKKISNLIHQRNTSFESANMTFEYMRRNLVELTLRMGGSFTEASTTLLPKYELFSIASGVGGLFGLFLGGSLLLAAEFLQLIANLGIEIWTRVGKYCLERKVRKVGAQ
ncbi:acid-sensing ion channel 2-like [Convolutriloba macropyga]|uniref:acid-sensing ion channel 2-like n=1 Tax=Convolutriloba macropyga TaxID=536237 RepID=UPI003F522AD2